MLFKIRCSAIGQIMTNAKGSITELQLKEIDELSAKDRLTEKQKEKLDKLRYKRNNPELSDTTKTFLDTWIKEQLYSRRKEFSNKYTEKGNIMEDDSIDLVADHYNYNMLIKNEKYYENDVMTGTPDVIINSEKLVIDVKNSWDCFTFPLFENEIPTKAYYWQLQGYMALLGFDKASLIYTLTDTPEHLIAKESYWYCQNNGIDNEHEVLSDFTNKMTYSNLQDELRIKRFDIERNNEDINKIEIRVNECRNYINEIIKTLM